MSSDKTGGKSLSAVVETLEKFAPPAIAEKWDNMGLLIEPCEAVPIKKILLTNDLTQQVVAEAVDKKINMIISYHPPIFKPLTRLTQQTWKERIVASCLYHGIAVYSPHTTWDKIKGGVNDWLASALPYDDIRPLQEYQQNMHGMGMGIGIGRYLNTTSKGIVVSDAVTRLQQHIDNPVHVGLGAGHKLSTPVCSVAICAGSGGPTLRGVKADVIITGEMSHHEVLEFNQSGCTVLLCNHSNSERGFLIKFQTQLSDMLNGECEVTVSKEDKDPLTTIAKALTN